MGELTDAYTEAFDGYREAFELPSALQFLEKKAGQDQPSVLLEIHGGWKPSEERLRGQVETLFTLLVADRNSMTPDVMSRVNRIQWGDNYVGGITYNPPTKEPRIWTFFAKEVKVGAIK